MSYRLLRCRIEGTSPLLMHSAASLDPMNPHHVAIAEISHKRKKTESDFLELARREFLASIYLHNGTPCVPGLVMEAVIVEGAKRQRRGRDAKAGVLVSKDAPLIYDGPRDPEILFTQDRFVNRAPVNLIGKRVIRTRPMFSEWAAEIDIEYLPSVISERDLRMALVAAGELVGMGDWRPRFGRFRVA